MNFIVIIVIVLVICHSILENLEIKGNYENYASDYSLQKIDGLNYTFNLLIDMLKVNNQTFKVKSFSISYI